MRPAYSTTTTMMMNITIIFFLLLAGAFLPSAHPFIITTSSNPPSSSLFHHRRPTTLSASQGNHRSGSTTTKDLPPPTTTINQQQPKAPCIVMDHLPSIIHEGSLLEGLWEVTSSNDVTVKHKLLVEIHGDQTFRVLGRKRASAFSVHYRRTGKFCLQPPEDCPEGMGLEEGMADGELFLYPESQHLESVAGVSLPIPDPATPPSPPPSSSEEEESSNRGALDSEGVEAEEAAKKKRVRVVLEDRNTMVLVFSDANKFYVLHRASSASTSDEAHQNTPIYALVTTNILGWIISNLLGTVGDDVNHLAHLAHIFK